jgi:hypothetical protein
MAKPRKINTEKIKIQTGLENNQDINSVKRDQTPKRKTGFSRKERIELTIQTIGLLAVGLPVWLFYLQQNNEIQRQRALVQLEIYSNATTKLHSLLNYRAHNPMFDSIKQELFNQIYPKIILLNDTLIIRKFDQIKDNLFLYGFSSKRNVAIDSLLDNLDKVIYLLQRRKKTENFHFASRADSWTIKPISQKEQENLLYFYIPRIYIALSKITYFDNWDIGEVYHDRKETQDIKKFSFDDSILVHQLFFWENKIIDSIYFMHDDKNSKFVNLDFSKKKNITDQLLTIANDSTSYFAGKLSDEEYSKGFYLKSLIKQLDSLMIASNALLYKKGFHF